jgi:hypothetical protein
MAVISSEGVQRLPDETLDQLSALYDDFQKTTDDALEKELTDLKLGEVDDSPNAKAPTEGEAA